MGRKVMYDSQGNEVSCMQEFDALENPCGECGVYDCDKRTVVLEEPYRKVIHGVAEAREYLLHMCDNCPIIHRCNSEKVRKCKDIKEYLKEVYC